MTFQPDVRPLGWSLYSEAEVPAGSVNGVNSVFTLTNSPTPNASLRLYLNGVLQTQGVDYALNGNLIIFTTPPVVGGALISWYRY
jgi:hypothetical protein